MKEYPGKIVGIDFMDLPPEDGEECVLMVQKVLYGDVEINEMMAKFTFKQACNLMFLKDKVVINNPEPLHPWTSWSEYIDGLEFGGVA
jgi:hypothetical protein